jgi:hypothetical protein
MLPDRGGGVIRVTWVKLGSEYADDLAFAGVSDGAFRLHTEAIVWLCRVESMNLRIAKRLVLRFAGCLDPDQAAKELVAAGLWRDHGDTYEVIHHAHTIRQGLAAQLDRRVKERERQRRKRAAAAKRAAAGS